MNKREQYAQKVLEQQDKPVFNNPRLNSKLISSDVNFEIIKNKKSVDDFKKTKSIEYPIPNDPNLPVKDRTKLESKVLEEAKSFLDKQNIWHMRINVEGLQREGYTQTNPNKGFSDLMIHYKGFVIFAECKRPYRAKYSQEQGVFLAHAYKNRQVAGFFNSLETLQLLLKQAETGMLIRPPVIHAQNLPEVIDMRGKVA